MSETESAELLPLPRRTASDMKKMRFKETLADHTANEWDKLEFTPWAWAFSPLFCPSAASAACSVLLCMQPAFNGPLLCVGELRGLLATGAPVGPSAGQASWLLRPALRPRPAGDPSLFSSTLGSGHHPFLSRLVPKPGS